MAFGIRCLALLVLCLSLWSGVLVSPAAASSFTMDDYVQAVLNKKPLPSAVSPPQSTTPQPAAAQEKPANSPSPATSPSAASSSSSTAVQPIRTPQDYYNAVINKKTTTVYYNWQSSSSTAPASTTPPSGNQNAPEQQQPASPPSVPGGLTADEARLFGLINSARSGEGVPPLELDTRLVEIARLKAQDMVANNYFGHVSPTYGSPREMLRKFGVSFRSAGENICKAADVNRAHLLLMNSPEGHRENILNPDFTKVGVAVVPQGSYVLVVELFIAP